MQQKKENKLQLFDRVKQNGLTLFFGGKKNCIGHHSLSWNEIQFKSYLKILINSEKVLQTLLLMSTICFVFILF